MEAGGGVCVWVECAVKAVSVECVCGWSVQSVEAGVECVWVECAVKCACGVWVGGVCSG